jgi:hypothetical protein
LSPVVAEVNGISAMNLSACGVPLNLELGLCLVASRCGLETAFFTDGGPLTGLFRLGDTNDDLFMEVDASFLWSGYITSDGPFMATMASQRAPSFAARPLPNAGCSYIM